MEIIFYLITVTLGIILSCYDIKSQEYPLIIWLGLTLLLLLFYPANLTFLIFCLLGFVTLINNIGIGAGDFFYLASLGLGLTVVQILWIIQIASLLGIVFYMLKLNNSKTIAFLPFLLLGYGTVLVASWIGVL
ncbi:hypothetical protein [Streptococcus plurextorum]|uniref:hypothetical protein n=1 Tax=Streptococcus plurextorum TaxID=456876 RepID=UPI0004296D0E|nr:hypothetical protein [Streptococcus plurextorum]